MTVRYPTGNIRKYETRERATDRYFSDQNQAVMPIHPPSPLRTICTATSSMAQHEADRQALPLQRLPAGVYAS